VSGWDLFTWVSSVGLEAGVVLIFELFLRDARDDLEQQQPQDEAEQHGA
jgi:hypothetical protein